MLDTLKNTFFPDKRIKLLRAVNKAIDERDAIQKSIDDKNNSFSLLLDTTDDEEIIKSYEDIFFEEIASLNSSKQSAIKKISDLHLMFSNEIFKSEDVEDKKGKLRYADKMVHSLNYKREDMPQIDADSIGDFIIHFGEKAGIKKVKKTISKLKPSQGEINDDKVHDVIGEQFSEGYDGSKVRYIISSDDYILDGHHRWAGDLELDSSKKVECYQVNLPIKILIQRAKKLKISNKRDIEDNTVEKSELLINYETLENLPISKFYKSLIVNELRPIGIPNEEFLKTIEIVKSLEGQDIFEKAKAAIAGKRPVRRIVRRKDGTVFSQVFWESIEETENVPPKSERPSQENMSKELKKMFEEQTFADRIVKKGDLVNVRFVGSIFGGKYNFKGWKVLSVKADRIIVECPENIHTRQPKENPVSFRKGARFEIPKTNNPLWSEFQGFELELSDEELVTRKKWLSSLLNKDTIAQANKEGYKIMSDLVGKSEQEIAERLEKFNEKWRGFDPLHMFKKMKTNIKNHFGENSADSFVFNRTNTGGFDFNISVYKENEGRVMYMNRTSDDGRHNPGGIYNGKKGVYHNYFKLEPKYQGGGFAKKMFKELYDQYKASNVDYLAVHANINVGGYTWGSMGFLTNDMTDARMLLGNFERQKGKLTQIRTSYVIEGKDGVEAVKIQKGKILIKKDGEDFVDVTNEKTIKPEFVEEYKKLREEFDNIEIEAMDASYIVNNEDGDQSEKDIKDAQEILDKHRKRLDEIENKIDSLPKTKRYDIDRDGNVIDIKNCGFYSITQQDCDEAKAVFQEWCRKNPNESRFPVKLFCAIGNKKAGQAALLNTSWHGTINLNNPEERNHFERYLGYESSEVQQKNKNK